MDFDGDGHLDLVSGSYQAKLKEPGAPIYVFSGNGKGHFTAPFMVCDEKRRPITPASVPDDHPDTRNFRRGNATEPFFSDWDEDGDLDLIIGGMEGEIALFLNMGSREEPRFSHRGRLLKHAGRPIRVPGGEAAPELADWDGDGRVDLLAGCGEGAVYLFRNIGKSGQPHYAEGQVIIPARVQREILAAGERVVPGGTSRICVLDWNGDGRLDLLLGDHHRSRRVRQEGLSAKDRALVENLLSERAELVSQILGVTHKRESEMYRLGRRPKGIFLRYLDRLDPIYEKLEQLDKRLEPFVSPKASHGFVWVFLRR